MGFFDNRIFLARLSYCPLTPMSFSIRNALANSNSAPTYTQSRVRTAFHFYISASSSSVQPNQNHVFMYFVYQHITTEAQCTVELESELPTRF